jgi:hypothetical protein
VAEQIGFRAEVKSPGRAGLAGGGAGEADSLRVREINDQDPIG